MPSPSLLTCSMIAALVWAILPFQELPMESSMSAGVEGIVRDANTGDPVPRATVSLLSLDMSAVSDAQGNFSLGPVSLDANPYLETIVVSAEGYGPWRLEGVAILAQDTLILQVDLEKGPVTIDMPPQRQEPPGTYRLQEVLPSADAISTDVDLTTLPATIRVMVFGPPYGCDQGKTGGEIQEIDFKDYVSHVLPNEWIYAWPGESLRAGAMAVKMYGWYWILYPGTWDVRDDACDQVYNPAVEYASTNAAVEHTWNWGMTRSGGVFLPHYSDWGWRCDNMGWADCIGQWDSYYHALGNNSYDKLTWDEMLLRYYAPIELEPVEAPPPGGYALRFYGNGWGDIDRIKIPLEPQVAVDVGGDFTLEWWMRAYADENIGNGCTSGSHESWTFGNRIFDRDVFGPGDHGEYGISLADGRIAFGIHNGTASYSLCGAIDIADGRWHHVAVTRRTAGDIAIFIDGQLDSSGSGPPGDISYRDGRATIYPASDPFLVIGTEKRDTGVEYPAYSGWLDEIRLSNIIRYASNFTPPESPFGTDAATVALYHLDEGFGNTIRDQSGALEGPSDGLRIYGGDPNNGPEWVPSYGLFLPERMHLPSILR